MPATHGVLFDVGYGLMDEWPRCLAALRWLSAYLNRHGLKTTPEMLVQIYTKVCRVPHFQLDSLMVQAALAAGASGTLARTQRQYMPWDAVPLSPLPEALSALKMLHEAGLRVGVLANQPASAARDLQRSGLMPYLNDIWLSEVVGLAKPNPAFFQMALADWQLPADHVAYVGDRPDHDIAPAKRIGMHTVRLLVGPHAEQPVRHPGEQADYETFDLLDAAQYLLRWANVSSA